jgi:hypothetical protein
MSFIHVLIVVVRSIIVSTVVELLVLQISHGFLIVLNGGGSHIDDDTIF